MYTLQCTRRVVIDCLPAPLSSARCPYVFCTKVQSPEYPYLVPVPGTVVPGTLYVLYRQQYQVVYYEYKMKKTPAVRSRISSKLIFASYMGYFDRAYYGFCVNGTVYMFCRSIEDQIHGSQPPTAVPAESWYMHQYHYSSTYVRQCYTLYVHPFSGRQMP